MYVYVYIYVCMGIAVIVNREFIISVQIVGEILIFFSNSFIADFYSSTSLTFAEIY
jgi:hypothetical protein